jgi:hypothetical protein
MRISGLFLYYLQLDKIPLKPLYTPPKCVKSV